MSFNTSNVKRTKNIYATRSSTVKLTSRICKINIFLLQSPAGRQVCHNVWKLHKFFLSSPFDSRKNIPFDLRVQLSDRQTGFFFSSFNSIAHLLRDLIKSLRARDYCSLPILCCWECWTYTKPASQTLGKETREPFIDFQVLEIKPTTRSRLNFASLSTIQPMSPLDKLQLIVSY